MIHGIREDAATGDLFLLSERQMVRISPYFPLSHGVPRVDDCRVVSGIVDSERKSVSRVVPASAQAEARIFDGFSGAAVPA